MKSSKRVPANKSFHKEKTKEELKFMFKRERRSNNIFVFITILLTIMIITIMLADNYNIQKKDKLLLYSIEQTSFCSDKLNISFEELSKDFLKYKIDCILNNSTCKK